MALVGPSASHRELDQLPKLHPYQPYRFCKKLGYSQGYAAASVDRG